MNRAFNTGLVSAKSGKPHLPFEELLRQLQSEGFTVRPDDYIEILKIVEGYGTANIHQLKYRLAPLLATSEEEQAKFYKVFDRYAESTRKQDKQRREYNWKKIVIVAFLAAAILLAAFFVYSLKPSDAFTQPPAFFSVVVNGESNSNTNTAVLGDTIQLDASSVFSNVKDFDTTGLQLSWNLGNTWGNLNQRRVSFLATKTGELLVQLKVQSQKYPNYSSIDSQYINVCTGALTSLSADKYDSLRPRDQVRISPVVRGSKTFLSSPVWVVNDLDTTGGETLTYTFDSAGSYNVVFYPAGKETNSSCNQSQSAFFEVKDEQDNIQLTAVSPGAPLQPTSKIASWLWLLLLIPVTGLLLTWWRQRLAKKTIEAKTHEGKEETIDQEQAKQVNNPPYEIPLQNRDIDLVVREPEMNLFFRAMRTKTEDECRVLNIPKSIQSEMRLGGAPSLVFTNKIKAQEYLILVDKSIANSQQAKLFEYMVKLLGEENINFERFFYRDFSTFFNENFPSGISLQRLAELYKNDVLIVFGNAHQLIYPAYPAVEKEKLNLLQEWDYKAVLTPVAYRDWGAKEDAMKKEFVLLPADVQGQIQLLQAIKERRLQHDKYLRSFPAFYETGSWYFIDVEEIKSYLDDPVLFQWLCAICVYPKLRWEVVVEVGKRVCAAEGHPGKFSFSSLLKLVRIQWMAEGYIPEQTRLDLLKKLSVKNEVAARETVLEMLRYPDLYFKGDYFFKEEKKLQEATNRFVLFAHDAATYNEYKQDYDLFKSRWEEGKIYDSPLKRYLDKRQGDNWETPIHHNQLSTGVNEFFKLKTDDAIQNINRQFRPAYWAFAGLLLFLTGLLFFGKPLLKTISGAKVPLVITDTTKSYQLSFAVNIDSCVKDPALFANGLSGNIRIDQTEYPLNFVSLKEATALVRYTENMDTGIVSFSWDEGQSSVSSVIPLSEKNSLYLRACNGLSKPLLSVRYNSSDNNDSLSMLLELLSNNYTIVDQRPDSFTESQIFYTLSDTTKGAQALADIINNAWGRNLPVEYYREDTMMEKPDFAIRLNINFIVPEVWTVVPLTSLPESLTEIWKGATNNRLMTISLVDRYIWYSTGDKNTYGTYRIMEASRKGDVTKIIVSAGNQFRVFFLQNISESGFNVCFSSLFFNSKSEADKIERDDCKNSMDLMRIYYPAQSERSAQTGGLNYPAQKLKKFQYPLVSAQALNASELRSAQNFFRTNTYSAISVESGYNDFWKKLNLSIPVYSAQNLSSQQQLQNLSPVFRSVPPSIKISGTIIAYAGTPFDRDYVDINLTLQQANPVDPCTITYQSVDEAIKARTACRLVLANQGLEKLPPNLNQLTNLQFLDIRNNNLVLTDSFTLQKMLPKCLILFTPQKRKVQPTDWVFMKRIEVDQKYQLTSADESYFTTELRTEVRLNPKGIIKLIGYYESASELKTMPKGLSQLKAYLNKILNLPDNNIQVEIQSLQQSQRNIQTSKRISKKVIIDIYGMNF